MKTADFAVSSLRSLLFIGVERHDAAPGGDQALSALKIGLKETLKSRDGAALS